MHQKEKGACRLKTLSEIRTFFERDRFAGKLGFSIDEAADGSATCSVRLGDNAANALGGVQGGLIYALADYAFAVAVNAQNCDTGTLSSTIQHLRPPSGAVLSATAIPIRRSKAVAHYRVNLYDGEGNLVAHVVTTGYTRNTK